jgi:DNA polymerase-3 subunit delta
MVEPELGLLDQELAKLAAYAGAEKQITADIVTQLVGDWRVQTAWEMLDAAAAGDAAQALTLLDHLLYGGEVPIVLLAQMASSLRRFATATRLIQLAEGRGQRLQLREALTRAGFKPFVIGKAETQLRQIGRVRAGKLYTWLIDADLALKGASSSPPRARFVLEQLICRLSKAAV